MPAGMLRQALTSDADDVELQRWPTTRGSRHVRLE